MPNKSTSRTSKHGTLTPVIRLRADGVAQFTDFSAYNLSKLIAEMDYYWSEEDISYWELAEKIVYYRKLAEIVTKARRELTRSDFEKFCDAFCMTKGTDRRRHLFALFAAFDLGEIRVRKDDFFV